MAKNIPQRKRLAAIFVSFSILIMGGVSLMENMSIDYYTVVSTLEKIIPASLIMGALGWVMGMILDKPRKRRVISYNNLFMNDIKNDISEASSDISSQIDQETESGADKDEV